MAPELVALKATQEPKASAGLSWMRSTVTVRSPRGRPNLYTSPGCIAPVRPSPARPPSSSPSPATRSPSMDVHPLFPLALPTAQPTATRVTPANTSCDILWCIGSSLSRPINVVLKTPTARAGMRWPCRIRNRLYTELRWRVYRPARLNLAACRATCHDAPKSFPSPRRSSRCSPSWRTRYPMRGPFCSSPSGRVPRDRVSRLLGRLHPERDLKRWTATSRNCTTRCSRGCRRAVLIDGEIVITTARGLDFDALQMRLHPAASRVAKLAHETPASFVAFDLLASRGRDEWRRRKASGGAVGAAVREAESAAPSHAHDAGPGRRGTLARAVRGCGLDGVIAKAAALTYQPGKRAMIKVKHARTADCVVADFAAQDRHGRVGSLLLGLYDDRGALQHVGVTSSFTMAARKQLVKELAPLRQHALEQHPWRAWAQADARSGRMPARRVAGAPARTSRGSRCASSGCAR